MKKLFLGLILTSSLIACKKETKLPSTNISGTKTDTTNVVDQPTSGYGPNISDTDGNTYKTVYIGKQRWMAENLKTTKYSDGTVIPNVTDANQWTKLTTAAWCNYKNNNSLDSIYGKLYNWYALSPTTNGNKNVCPTGWHVPTDTELRVLINFLGGVNIAGGKLKETGVTNWYSPNKEASNFYKFTGNPGGNRNFSDGNFYYFGEFGYWWSSTEQSKDDAWFYSLYHASGYFNKVGYNKKMGFSIRCIEDN
jgi:uncharacterized protein (TIGR02145 family)